MWGPDFVDLRSAARHASLSDVRHQQGSPIHLSSMREALRPSRPGTGAVCVFGQTDSDTPTSLQNPGPQGEENYTGLSWLPG